LLSITNSYRSHSLSPPVSHKSKKNTTQRHRKWTVWSRASWTWRSTTSVKKTMNPAMNAPDHPGLRLLPHPMSFSVDCMSFILLFLCMYMYVCMHVCFVAKMRRWYPARSRTIGKVKRIIGTISGNHRRFFLYIIFSCWLNFEIEIAHWIWFISFSSSLLAERRKKKRGVGDRGFETTPKGSFFLFYFSIISYF
jgi:hypothetical protein